MYQNLCFIMITLLIILIILLIFKLFKNDEIIVIDDDEIVEYKIGNRKKVDLSDTFNIKEYDVINDNIIIHNKFKNELLDSKKNKECYKKKKNQENESQKERINKLININAKKLKIQELNKQYNITSSEVSSLKSQFKLDLNNFLNDKKQNKVSKDEIRLIIKKLNIEISNNLNKIKQIHLTYSDIDDINLINRYENILLTKDDILNKKKNIYIRFI